MQAYHQLEVWQRAMDYAVRIYELSAGLPVDERFNLTSQIGKAALSVPLNIAEGCACATRAEFGRFLICISLVEGDGRLSGAVPASVSLHARGLCATDMPLIDEGNQISRMTYNLMHSVGASNESREP